MQNLLIFTSIIDWIKAPFGYLLEYSYKFTGSYAIAIIIFAVVIRLILLPLGIKQQKGMIKQAKLRPKEMAIRNKYKGRTDKKTQEKLNAEIMELYQKENYSPFSGCLPLLIQLPVILILFYVVTAPITYIVPDVMRSEVNFTVNHSEEYVADPAGVDNYIIEAINLRGLEDFDKDVTFKITNDGVYNDKGELCEGKVTGLESIRKNAITKIINEWFPAENGKNRGYKEIAFIQDFKNASPEVQDAIVAAVPAMEELKDFDCTIFGFIDLLGNPAFFNWLLLLPILSGISAFLQTKISKKLNGVAAQPADTSAADATKSLKLMDYMMPLFNVYITYIVPASVGFYWLMSNIIMILQNVLLAKLYPIPKAEELEEQERLAKKAAKLSKKNKNTFVADENEYKEIETPTADTHGFDFGTMKDDKKDN